MIRYDVLRYETLRDVPCSFMQAVLFEFPLLERPFRLTALELLLPIPQFTGAISKIANGPLAAITSVALITGVAASGVPLGTLAGLSGSTGGAILIYIGPALMTLKLRAQREGSRFHPSSSQYCTA